MEAGYTECCADQDGDCAGSDPFDCYCDVFCYYLDDCCTDIDDICEQRTFPPPTINGSTSCLLSTLNSLLSPYLAPNFLIYLYLTPNFIPPHLTDAAVIDGKCCIRFCCSDSPQISS